MGVYTERSLSRVTGFILLAISFAALFQPWNLEMREFFKLEGLYAACADELTSVFSVVTAHGVVIQNGFPLFPAAGMLLNRVCGLPMETALRLTSIIMLAASTVMIYFAAASDRTPRAGMVAAAMYFSTILVMEKGGEGYPTTMSAFFLLAAQLLFFQFGFRRSNWSAAWIVSLGLMVFAFFSGGFLALVYFVFPMLFLQRPLSVRSKFRKPGFAIGILMLTLPIAAWGLACWNLSQKMQFLYIWWGDTSMARYLIDVAVFPCELPFRLLPWSIIAWLPFCVMLQSLDTTPIYSRYLRTLTIPTLVLLWLMPDTTPREIIYLLGPLSILVGINYDIGMRRYGTKLRNGILKLAGWTVASMAVAMVVLCLISYELLSLFVRVSLSIDFCRTPEYRMFALGAGLVLVVLAIVLSRGVKTNPVWMTLLLTSVGIGIFYWSVLQPYRAQERSQREMGQAIRTALKAEKTDLIYKDNITGLYGELYYSGCKAVNLTDLENMPQKQIVYLLGAEFPQQPNREWTNLLPPDFSYRDHRLFLWKGVLHAEENLTRVSE
ncbi:MAG: hypothetical protein PHI35_04695 [Victivallaceae bacterium]|nr:hypothetical protein [Victivallaceae bacterium]